MKPKHINSFCKEKTMNIQRIRKDFPILQKEFRGKHIIYWDNACMTLKPGQVIEKVREYYEELSVCAGRSSYKLGELITEEYEKTRKIISKFIGARKTEEIVFTKNTTEGINLLANSLNIGKNDVVLTSDREHNSNLLPWQLLRKKKRIVHKVVPSSKDFTFDLNKFQETFPKNTKLVSVVWVSNLDGYELPVKDIIKISHDYGARVLVDGAQGVPHKEVNVKRLGVDFLCFSGHKMLGPTGTGVLYGKYDLLEELEPFILGGETVESSTYQTHTLLKPPKKFEAGLQNYAGILGLGEAVRYLKKIGMENIEKHESKINKFVSEGLLEFGAQIIGVKNWKERNGIVSFNIPGMNYHEVGLFLDYNYNIMVRSGQQCVHSWFQANEIPGSVRASFYLYNTLEEAEIFMEALEEITHLR